MELNKRIVLGKTLIWTMVFALVMTLIPNFHNDVVSANSQKDEELEGDLQELIGLRTDDSKTYLDTNTNEYILDQYTEAIHYEEGNKWKDIDNSIIEGKAETDDSSLALENKANKFKVKFSNKSKDDKTVRLKWKKKQLDIGLVGTNKVKGLVENNSITYPNVLADTDLVFYADSNSVKEELVFHKQPSQNKFVYQINMKGLTAKLDSNGEILFEDEKENVYFTVSKPFMFDANEEFSHDVKMELREEKGKTFIDVTADKAWLDDKDREYPVILDPSVIVQDEETADTMISSAYPDSNYWLDPSLITGKQIYYGTTRSLVKFNLANVLSGAKISSANFKMTSHSNTNGFNHSASVGLFPVSKIWDSSTVTWNNQPTIEPQASNLNVTTDGEYTFFITNLVKDWYSGTKANNGFMMKHIDENINRKMFHSSDHSTDPLKKPKLTVVYTIEPIGVESYWTTGATSVNTYNGNYYSVETDIEYKGRGIPLAVERSYNSRSTENGYFGNKWSSNLDQHLQFSNENLISFRDMDGTRHTFVKKSDGFYESPGGVNLTLEKNSDSTYKLINSDQSFSTFDTNGKIITETDSNNNITKYTYTGSRLTSVTDASGRKLTLNYNSAGQITSIIDPSKNIYNYTYDSNNNLISVLKKDTTGVNSKSFKYTYDSHKQMITYTNPNNHQIKMFYNDENRLIRIEKPVTNNETLQLDFFTMTYDLAKGISVFTDAKGVKTEYTHNSYGNVVKSVSDLGGLNNTRTFFYDEKNNLVQTKDENSNKNGGNDSSNYAYDEKGNLISSENHLNEKVFTQYDENNNPLSFEDARGNQSFDGYDEKNNNVASTDSNTKSSSVKYDSYGNIIEDTNFVSIGENLLVNGSFEKILASDTWASNWKKIGNATFSIENSGISVQNAKLGTKQLKISNPTTASAVESDRILYDAKKSYVVSGFIRTNNASANAKLVVTGGNSSGQMTKTISSGMLKGTTGVERVSIVINEGDFPEGTTFFTLKAYVNGGIGEYFFDGLQVEEEYYGAYNLIENSNFEILQNGKPENWYYPGTLTSGDGIDGTTSYTGKNSIKLTGQRGVDKFVRQELKVSGNAKQEFTVSGFSKVDSPTPNIGSYQMNVSVNHKDGTVQWINADFDKSKSHDWQHTSLNFAALKDFNSITIYYQFKDQTGTAWFDTAKAQLGAIRTKYTYDSLGNYKVNELDQIGNSAWRSYDSAGNMTGETIAGDTRQYEYDFNNALKKVIDEEGKSTTYNYDSVGNHTSTIDSKGQKTTFNYNEKGDIVSLIDSLGRKITYEYDVLGNLTKTVDPNGSQVSTSYNNVNQKTETYYNGTKKFEFAYDANGNVITEKNIAAGVTTTYSYDAENKIKEKSNNLKSKVLYGYDENGNVISNTFSSGLSTITTNYKYDKNDQLINVSNTDTMTSFTYSENDEIAGIKNKNGTYTLKDYDGAGQLTRIVTNDENGNLLESFEYKVDEKGNNTSEKSKEGLSSFIYDKKEQLVKETRANGDTYEYTYDTVGNRLTKKITKGTSITSSVYGYDSSNQLISINGVKNQYDNNGNLINDGKRTYVYDAEDRLIEIKEGTTSIAKYEYDSEGLRMKKTIGTKSVNYHYDENKNVILETDSAANILVSYVYDKDNRPLTMTKNGQTYTFHSNGRGDITSVTDATSKVVAEFEYDSWGNVIKQSGVEVNNIPFRYAGYRYDAETKLYYLQQRYYNPEIGRFFNKDPLLGVKELPISQNGYAYADNNPVMNTDPNGMFSVPRKLKSIMRTFITFIFDDFIKNTLTNAVLIVSGGGVGAWTARKMAMKGFTMIARHPNRKAIKGFITGGVLAYITGSWFSKAAGIAQHWIGKLWKYEKWFDRNWLGKRIDNGLRKAKSSLLRRI